MHLARLSCLELCGSGVLESGPCRRVPVRCRVRASHHAQAEGIIAGRPSARRAGWSTKKNEPNTFSRIHLCRTNYSEQPLYHPGVAPRAHNREPTRRRLDSRGARRGPRAGPGYADAHSGHALGTAVQLYLCAHSHLSADHAHSVSLISPGPSCCRVYLYRTLLLVGHHCRLFVSAFCGVRCCAQCHPRPPAPEAAKIHTCAATRSVARPGDHVHIARASALDTALHQS